MVSERYLGKEGLDGVRLSSSVLSSWSGQWWWSRVGTDFGLGDFRQSHRREIRKYSELPCGGRKPRKAFGILEQVTTASSTYYTVHVVSDECL